MNRSNGKELSALNKQNVRPSSYFKADIERFLVQRQEDHSSLVRKIYLVAKDFGIHCIAAYRLARFARKLRKSLPLIGWPLSLIAAVLRLFTQVVTHVVFFPTSEIGPGLFIEHATSIYVAADLGSNCTLHQCSTLGYGFCGRERYGRPTTGDNVWFGPNVVVTGPVQIGSSVTVGAGTILSKDVPDGALVIGNPGRIIEAEYANDHLIKTMSGVSLVPGNIKA